MSRGGKEKRQARALQEETGWKYLYCINLLRTKTDAEIDMLVAEAKAKPTGDDHRTKAQKVRAEERDDVE